MKINKFIFSFILIFAIVSFQSCENEPIDSDLLFNNEDPDDVDDEDDVIGESTGDYWPRAIGNMWNFNDAAFGEVTYNMVSTEEIDGDTYYRFDNLVGQESWLRKTGDSYYIRTAVVSFPIDGYDVSTTFLTLRMLIDSAEIGEQWENNVSYTISYTPTVAGYPEIPNIDFSANYGFEMMGRDLTRTVEGTEYQNVLHVKLTLTAAGNLSTVDYYYAKDIGLIEFSSDGNAGTLMSYSLN
ncbi:hypothetical protein [Psychroserpens sp.]